MALRLSSQHSFAIGGVFLFNSDRVGSAGFAAHYDSHLGNVTLRYGYGHGEQYITSEGSEELSSRWRVRLGGALWHSMFLVSVQRALCNKQGRDRRARWIVVVCCFAAHPADAGEPSHASCQSTSVRTSQLFMPVQIIIRVP
jgi:hypothetical protein